jgi:histone-lysine N-methyltransferase SETMAR
LGRWWFDDVLKEKRPHLTKKKVLFHQANAPAYRSLLVSAKLVELGCELLPHPPYSPDLAPATPSCFQTWKKWLGGKRFASDEEIITETEANFAVWQILFLEGLKKLESGWAKCIEPKSSYVEK